MHKLKIIVLNFLLLLFLVYCSSSQQSSPVTPTDSIVPQHNEEELVNDEPPPPPVDLPAYDGTLETAKKQVEEIRSAIENKKLTAYTYLYDNGSGENIPLNGTLYFSADDSYHGKGQE